MTQSSPESERGRSLVVDTSACVAVILGEPGSEDLAAYLEHALVRLMPAAIRVELGIVIEARLWPAGQDVVDRFLRDAKIDIVAVDEELAARAISGWRRYGKGRHPAALNFGDCFTYALAERTGIPCSAPATTSQRPASPCCVRLPGTGDRKEPSARGQHGARTLSAAFAWAVHLRISPAGGAVVGGPGCAPRTCKC